MRNRLAYKFGITEEKAFTGSGRTSPWGVQRPRRWVISTARDTAAAATTAIAGDDLINTKFALKQQYWAKARWLCHRDFLKAVRKLKDQQNNYLWSPGLGPGGGLTAGIPATLLDTPYDLSEYAPNTFTAGLYAAILGDFSFYWIAEALQLEIQVPMELYAETTRWATSAGWKSTGCRCWKRRSAASSCTPSLVLARSNARRAALAAPREDSNRELSKEIDGS